MTLHYSYSLQLHLYMTLHYSYSLQLHLYMTLLYSYSLQHAIPLLRDYFGISPRVALHTSQVSFSFDNFTLATYKKEKHAN